MKLNGPFNQVKLSRRSFLLLGGISGYGALMGYALGPKEEVVWQALYRSWTEGWTPKSSSPLKDIEAVLEHIREDKRADLSLAFKLLTFAPTCFYLTGYFFPWKDPYKVSKIIQKWQFSERSEQKKIYCGVAAIINSSFYGRVESYQDIGYPGAPSFSFNEGAL